MANTPNEIAARVREIEATARVNRIKFAGVGVVGAACCLGAGFLTSEPVHGLAAAGLSSDIVGALLLASGLMLPDWLVGEMGTMRWGSNPFVQAYWGAARRDAVVAATLLVVGFLLQAMSATIA